MLAAVSPDYYTRLEQGRSLPSLHVTQALAQALKLDAAATSHLHQLARHAPEDRRSDDATPSADGLQTLLDQWSATPAWVSDRHAQVLAANALMTSLNPAFAPGSNALRALFVDEPAMREIYVDYEDVASAAVASLRARNGAELGDRQLSELVSELAAREHTLRTAMVTPRRAIPYRWPRHHPSPTPGSRADGVPCRKHARNRPGRHCPLRVLRRPRQRDSAQAR